jgi:hypothetical protein
LTNSATDTNVHGCFGTGVPDQDFRAVYSSLVSPNSLTLELSITAMLLPRLSFTIRCIDGKLDKPVEGSVLRGPPNCTNPHPVWVHQNTPGCRLTVAGERA